jgi:hypothetical protein
MTAKTVWLGLKAERAENRRQKALAKLAEKNKAASAGSAGAPTGVFGAWSALGALFAELVAALPGLPEIRARAAKALAKSGDFAKRLVGRNLVEISTVAASMAIAKVLLAALSIWAGGVELWVDWPAWKAEMTQQRFGSGIPEIGSAADDAIDGGKATKSALAAQKALEKVWAETLGLPEAIGLPKAANFDANAAPPRWPSARLRDADNILPTSSFDGCFQAGACHTTEISWGDALLWGLWPSAQPRWTTSAPRAVSEKMAASARGALPATALWWILSGFAFGAAASVLVRSACEALRKKGARRWVAILGIFRGGWLAFALHAIVAGGLGVIVAAAMGSGGRAWVAPTSPGRLDAMAQGTVASEPGESFALYSDNAWDGRDPEHGRGAASDSPDGWHGIGNGAQCVERGVCAKIAPPERDARVRAVLGMEQKPVRLVSWPKGSDEEIWLQRGQKALAEWAQAVALVFWGLQAFIGFVAMCVWAAVHKRIADRFEARTMERLDRWNARGQPIAESIELGRAAKKAFRNASAERAAQAGPGDEAGMDGQQPPARKPSRI